MSSSVAKNQSLPNIEGDFKSKEYWERFFRNQTGPFEWYADYDDLSELFFKYCKSSDNILVIGCGNSELGVMLYDLHDCHSVVNIDNNHCVIKRMRKKYILNGSRPGLVFAEVDVLKLEQNLQETNLTGPYSCIIDKGTLDALYSSDGMKKPINCMFCNIDDYLTIGGRYIIITLAQSHLLKAILDYFIINCRNYILNCINVETQKQNTKDGFALPVFAIVLTKLNPSDSLPMINVKGLKDSMLVNLKGTCPIELADALTKWIQSQQMQGIMRKSLALGKVEKCLFSHPDSELGTFLVKLVRKRDVPRNTEPEAIFLVPYGMSMSPQYSSKSAENELLKSMGVKAILIVKFSPHIFYPCIEVLKDNVSEIVNNFLLRKNGKLIPICSTAFGYDRTLITKLSDSYIIDEVSFGEKTKILRLVDSRPNCFQPIIMAIPAVRQEKLPSICWNVEVPVLKFLNVLLGERYDDEEKYNIIYVGVPSPLLHAKHLVWCPTLDVKQREQVSSVMYQFMHVYTMRNTALFKKWFNFGMDEDHLPTVVVYDPYAHSTQEYRECFTSDKLRGLAVTMSTRTITAVIFVFRNCPPSDESWPPSEKELKTAMANTPFKSVEEWEVEDELYQENITKVMLFSNAEVDKSLKISSYKKDPVLSSEWTMMQMSKDRNSFLDKIDGF